MTSKNNSKNPAQKQDLVKRTFRLTPENDTLINDKSTQHELSRAELIRHCLDFCEANAQAFDAFVTGSADSSVDTESANESADAESVTDSVDSDSESVDPVDEAESTNSAVIEPGKPLIANTHLNSLVLSELQTSTRNLERFAHTAQQNRLSSVALQSMEISNRLKHIRDVLANE